MRRIQSYFASSVTYESLADGRSGSILSYNVFYAISFGWLIPRRGSVFSVVELVGVVSFAVILCTVLAACSCQYHKGQRGCIALPAASTSYLTLMTLCSFVVAFFANSVLQRWWTMRTHIQSVMGNSYELVMTIMSALSGVLRDPSLTTDERTTTRREAEEFSQHLVGLLIVVFHSLFNQARGIKDLDLVRQRGYISSQEIDLLESVKGGPLHVCTIISSLVQDSLRRGVLSRLATANDCFLQTLPANISNIRTNASMVMLYIDVQLPFPFGRQPTTT